MREVARFAEARDLPTITTNCYEIERGMPYQPVIDFVSRALDRVPSAALQDMALVSLAELAALVPEVAERVPGPATTVERLSRGAPSAAAACRCATSGGLQGRPAIHSHGGRHPMGGRGERTGPALPRPPSRRVPDARDLRLSRRRSRQRRTVRAAGRELAPRDRRPPHSRWLGWSPAIPRPWLRRSRSRIPVRPDWPPVCTMKPKAIRFS